MDTTVAEPAEGIESGAVAMTLDERMEELLGGSPADVEPVLETAFDKIFVSIFPPTELGKVIEIPSSTKIKDAIRILVENKIQSAPVKNVDAAESAGWMEQYLGICDISGIALWVLEKLEFELKVEKCYEILGGDLSEDFTQAIEKLEVFETTTVQAVTKSLRWGPFLPVTTDDSILAVLLMMSEYKFHRVPVINVGEEKITNFITQSAVINLLAEVKGQWFENVGNKTVAELGLPLEHGAKPTKVDSPFRDQRNAFGIDFTKPDPARLTTITEDQPVLEAFRMLRDAKLNAVPVLNKEGRVVGNISARDIHLLLTQPGFFSFRRPMSISDFMDAAEKLGEEQRRGGPVMRPPLSCRTSDTLKEVIASLAGKKMHNIYVLGSKDELLGVVTLEDIISCIVSEPEDGWLADHLKRMHDH